VSNMFLLMHIFGMYGSCRCDFSITIMLALFLVFNAVILSLPLHLVQEVAWMISTA